MEGRNKANSTTDWWHRMTTRLALADYFATQKYSLFDNENDEIGIGLQSPSVYGTCRTPTSTRTSATTTNTATTNTTATTHPRRPTPNFGQFLWNRGRRGRTAEPYQSRPSLLQCSPMSNASGQQPQTVKQPQYVPVSDGRTTTTADCATKLDPVAVLAVSKSTFAHHCPTTRLIVDSVDSDHNNHHNNDHHNNDYHNDHRHNRAPVHQSKSRPLTDHHYQETTSSSTPNTTTTTTTTITTTKTFGSSGNNSWPCPKGQKSGEYCLFSSSTVHGSKTSASIDAPLSHRSTGFWSSSNCPHKSQTNRRCRLGVASVVMGVLSLSLLVVLLVLLHAFGDASAARWSGQVTTNASGVKGTKSGSATEPSVDESGFVKVPPPQRICQTEVCREAGKALYESINFEANPCDDFFEYSCGRWNKEHTIAEDKSRIGTFQLLDDALTEKMRSILEGQSPVEGRNNTNGDGSAKSVQFAIDLYKECMNRDRIEELGFEPVKSQLRQLLGTNWPILNAEEFEATRDANLNWMETFVRIYSLGFAPIVTFVVQPDANQTTTKRIYFDSPSFGLGRKEHANVTAYESTVTAYRKYMTDAATLLAGPKTDAGLLRTRLEEIFNFESKLALNSTPPENRRNAEVWYNRMTLNDFKQLTDSRLDWTELLGLYINRLNLSYQIGDQDLVIVEDVPYYKAVTALLEDTPDYVLYNYMGWMFTNHYAKYMGRQLQQLSFEYQRARQGVEKQLPEWKRCVSQVYSELNWAISRLYVDQYVTPGTKQSAVALIDDLKDSFRQVVLQDTWLDEVTRRRALEKLAAIRENVAYPDWILSNHELDKYYGFSKDKWLSVQSGRYFDSVLDINRFFMIKMYRELALPVNLTIDWPMPPAMVNAAYAPTQNSITIPVGILRPPFFDAGRPVVLNYGGIGSVIGHEITHGFDDQGQQFDKSGNLVDWWTEETKKRFTAGAKCFTDQYGKIVDKVTGKNLNGINTVGENIADNGGVREAYLAFQTYQSKTKTQAILPYMTKFTPEQLFFLSYANVWCGTARSQYLKMMIDYDPHSPLRYRVNVPLANYAQFAKAWNCPAGSRMNPTSDKCQLW